MDYSRVVLAFVGLGVVISVYARSQPKQCRAINEWAGNSDMDLWCTEHCAMDHCPEYGCLCDPPTIVTQSITTPSEPKTTPTEPKTTVSTLTVTPLWTNCKAINNWAGYKLLDRWCAINCASGNCPNASCKCFTQSMTEQNTPTIMTSSATTPTRGTTIPPVKTSSPGQFTTLSSQLACKAISIWKDIDVFDEWCRLNCAKGKDYCPSNTCECNNTVSVTESSRPASDATRTSKVTLTTNKPTSTSTSTHSVTSTISQTQAPHVLMSSSKYSRCRSNGVLAGDYWDTWCQKQCDQTECPTDYCYC